MNGPVPTGLTPKRSLYRRTASTGTMAVDVNASENRNSGFGRVSVIEKVLASMR